MISDFIDAIKEGNAEKKSTEVVAEVKEIDGDIVWVSIPGMDGDTPVQKTIDCKPGDTVTVRIENGTGRIAGNITTPPTGNAEVEKLKAEIQILKEQIAEIKSKL